MEKIKFLDNTYASNFVLFALETLDPKFFDKEFLFKKEVEVKLEIDGVPISFTQFSDKVAEYVRQRIKEESVDIVMSREFKLHTVIAETFEKLEAILKEPFNAD